MITLFVIVFFINNASSQPLLDTDVGIAFNQKSSRMKFLPEHEPILIHSNEDFIRYNFSGSGTLEDPYIIESFNITTSESTAISIYNTTCHFIIRNCFLSARDYGVYINYISQKTGRIINNTITANNKSGIYVLYSLGLRIENNLIVKNSLGISIFFGSKCIIKNNTIVQNTQKGIILEFSDNALIIFNIIQQNGGYGVFLAYTSDYNQIHHNWFIENFIGFGSQAWDDGKDNMWYLVYTLEGNYWSNWNGTGPYYIAGQAGSVDRYPLNINGTRETPSQTSTDTELIIGSTTIDFIVIIGAITILRLKRSKFKVRGQKL